MIKKSVSAIMLALLVISTIALAFEIQPVRASGTIYIQADGSITPSTAPIHRNGDTYALTGNITAAAGADGIVIQRDNIVVDGAGYTLMGSGSGKGITLTFRYNVALDNMTIESFKDGIYLDSSSGDTLSGNNVTANSELGIELGGFSSSNNVLSGNNVANNGAGIVVYRSSENTLSGNNVTNNGLGIELGGSSNNTLSRDVMRGNGYNLGVDGSGLNDFLQLVDTSNVVDGKPIYYFVNQSDILVNDDVYPAVGYLGFVNCVNITVQGMNLTNNEQGLLLANTNDSRITGNNITASGEFGIELQFSSGNTLSGNNVTATGYAGMYLVSSSSNTLSGNNVTATGYAGMYLVSSSSKTLSGNNVTANNVAGIDLVSCSNCTLSGNNVTTNSEYGILLESSNNVLSGNNVANNGFGIGLYSSSNNLIFHNNFVNNTNQVYETDLGFVNIWDNSYPSGGNYWSDYNGTDAYSGPSQNIPGSDGIGDTTYIIDANNTDRYPLMTTHVGVDDVAVTGVASSKAVIGTGFMVVGTPFSDNVTVVVADKGGYAETFNVTLYANSTVIGTEQVNLNATDSATLTFGWNTTTGLAYGNYIISAYAWPVPGETNTADNNFTAGVVKVTIPGDISGDFKVNLVDLVTLGSSYGSRPGDPKWNPNADIDGNGIVGLSDLVILAYFYGQHYP